MAKWKWTPGRRRAFAKMRRALKSRTNPRRRRRRRNPAPAATTATNPRRRRRRTTTRSRRRVTMINPRRRRHSATAGLGRVLALLPISGGNTMAKRRRKSRGGRRRRRNPGALMVNPRRRRRRARRANPRRRHHRRRRNPGTIQRFAKQGLHDIMLAAVPATVGGLVIGFVDSKFLGTLGTVGRNIGKLMTAILVGTVGRRFLGPVGTGVAVGAVLSTIGHEFGVKLGGGMVAMNKREGVQELVEMAATDAETQAELGALIEGNDFEDAQHEYEGALSGGIPDEYAALAAAAGEDDISEEIDDDETY